MHTEPAAEHLPRIIPRDQHCISRNNIDREALKVMYRLRDAGFTAYLVGGGVRDLLLGKTPKDFDISTDAHPGQLRKLFRNSRIIGRRFRLVQVFFRGDKVIEVSTFRCRGEEEMEGNEVLAHNNTFGSPEEDAFRRDLTINALFYEIEHFNVIDYTGGMDDLKSGTIRIVGDPARRIKRDPVRMLRAIRHAARTNFSIEKNTWQAVIANRQTLSCCPVSRLRDELFKDLHSGASKPWADLAIQSGLFFVLFPFYEPLLADDGSRSLLLKLLATNDRLHQIGQKLPDYLIIALLLVPWADATLCLFEARQGRELYQFSRQLRTSIDELLVNLNIKRADKEAITGLLANLALYTNKGDRENWPKKLQRKSYFQQGLQFFKIYREATGGERVHDLHFPRPAKKTRRERSHRPRGKAPAFSKRAKGGIFGLKK
ncbi:MAG: polynucleotide adenylyltransferase PcnB [Deltaproteobacteria bacterium]